MTSTTPTEPEALAPAELARQMLAHLDECNRIGKFSSIEEVHIRQICEALSTPVADPEVLPCDVMLPPATTIRAGCGMDTLLFAMSVPGRPRHFATPAARMLAGEGEATRLRERLLFIARNGRDMSGESCAETASSALHQGPTTDDILGLSRKLDPSAWSEADAGRHTRDNNIRLDRANSDARATLAHPPAAEPVDRSGAIPGKFAMLKTLTDADIAREGEMASVMVRAGLLRDLIDYSSSLATPARADDAGVGGDD